MRQVNRVLVVLVFASLLVAPVVLAEGETSTPPSPAMTSPREGDPATAPTASPADDPCRVQREEMERKIDAVHERYRQQRDELRKEHEAWDFTAHSEEENRAFEAKMKARHAELSERERAEIDAVHREYEGDCRPPADMSPTHESDMHRDGPAYGDEAMPRCAEDGLRADFEARMRAEMDAFHRTSEDKHLRFKERMQARYDEWHAGNHTENETAAFEGRMQDEWRAFDEGIAAESRAFEARMEAEHKRFFEEHSARCDAPDGHGDQVHPEGEAMRGDMPPELAAAAADVERLRMECEAQVHARAEEVRAASPEEGTDDGWRRVEAEVRPLVEACERKIRALWDEKIGAYMQTADAHERIGSWNMEEDENTVYLKGTYMTLTGDPTTNTLYDVAVSGVVFIEHLATEGRLEEFDMAEERGGSTLTATGEGLRLRLHDNPSGLVTMQAGNGHAFLLTLPDHVEVAGTGSGWQLRLGEHEAFVRVAPESSEWDESSRTLELQGEAVFMVESGADNVVLAKVANKHRGDIVAAVQDKRLGAEVTIAPAQDGGMVDDTLVYDAVEVVVEPAPEKDVVAVTVSSDELEEGKTFVLNVDHEILDVRGTIDVAYFDIDEETGAETPSEIRRASSLADVLDATDDETAEYWIVEDADGIQVLASVPHWSTHRIKVQSVGAEDGLLAGAPGPGLALLLGALGLAGVAAGRRRA